MPYEIKAKASGKTELWIYGDIGIDPWAEQSVDGKAVVEAIENDSSDIDMHINSYGGSVSDGLAIVNAMKRHGAVDVYIDGYAYSIASYIPMGARKIYAAKNAIVMVHGPHTIAQGNATIMEEAREMLEANTEAMLADYGSRNRIDKNQARGWLTDNKNHFFSANEAYDVGLVDEVLKENETFDVAASMRRYPSPADILRYKPKLGRVTAMADDKTTGAGGAPTDKLANHSQTVKAAHNAGVADEAARRQMVKSVYASHLTGDPLSPIDAAFEQCTDDSSCDELKARTALIEAMRAATNDPIISYAHAGRMSAGSSPAGASAHMGGATSSVDAVEKMRDGVKRALLVRAGLEKDEKIVREVHANELFGMGLVQLGEQTLKAAGSYRATGDKMTRAYQVLAAGHSVGDFPSILADVAHKAALVGYNEAPETWYLWAKVGNLSDFKTANRVTLGAFPDLDKIPASGEYEFAQISDIGETIRLATYGKKFRITRQAIVDDDMSFFVNVPRMMGRAAARVPGNLAYNTLTSNPVLNQDNTTVFHANHNNLVDTGSGAPISVATLDAGWTAMALQRDPDDNVQALNLEPAYVLTAKAQWANATTVIGSEKDPTYDATNPGTPKNPYYNRFSVIADARLDIDDPLAWYLMADANQADTIEVAFLNGVRDPVVEQMAMTSPDGRDYYVRLDCASAAMGYVGMYKNLGQ